MRNCKHGFNPVDGPGLWCPACDYDEKHPRPGLLTRVLQWFGWRL
jgi:hypothetical protein